MRKLVAGAAVLLVLAGCQGGKAASPEQIAFADQQNGYGLGQKLADRIITDDVSPADIEDIVDKVGVACDAVATGLAKDDNVRFKRILDSCGEGFMARADEMLDH